jgi:DNA-binding MurR/RpiR family transcriptional regulator
MPDADATSIAELIHNRLSSLTAAERKPAQVLLANYPVAGLETVAQFAKRAGVSGPTILRLVAKLGFSGYAEFQQSLRDELTERLGSPLSRHERALGPADVQGDALNKYTAAVCANLEQSAVALSRSEFAAVIGLLCDQSRDIYLLGGRFSGAIASYLYHHLRAIRPRVHLIGGQPDTWTEHLLDMQRRDVLLALDIRRYQEDVVRFAGQVARRRVTVVLMTDQWLSPISSVADHVLPVRIDVSATWDSSVALLMLAEALVAQLTDSQWRRVRKRFERLEALRPAAARR